VNCYRFFRFLWIPLAWELLIEGVDLCRRTQACLGGALCRNYYYE